MTIRSDGNDEYETPIMRDLSKLMPKVLLFMISFIVIFFVFLFPFNITEYCNNGIVMTSNSIAKTILSDLTGVCF